MRISLPAGVEISTFSSLYYFDDSAGEDVPVFIVDSGAALEHEVRPPKNLEENFVVITKGPYAGV